MPTADAELSPLQVRGWAGGAWCWVAAWGVGCCALPAQCFWQCCEAQPRTAMDKQQPWVYTGLLSSGNAEELLSFFFFL